MAWATWLDRDAVQSVVFDERNLDAAESMSRGSSMRNVPPGLLAGPSGGDLRRHKTKVGSWPVTTVC